MRCVNGRTITAPLRRNPGNTVFDQCRLQIQHDRFALGDVQVLAFPGSVTVLQGADQRGDGHPGPDEIRQHLRAVRVPLQASYVLERQEHEDAPAAKEAFRKLLQRTARAFAQRGSLSLPQHRVSGRPARKASSSSLLANVAWYILAVMSESRARLFERRSRLILDKLKGGIMISSTGRRLTTSWWMFALLCPVGLVWAQEGGVAQGSAGSPPTAARGIVEEVVVTARRREESLQSAPLAVTAFTGEQIERLVIDDISEFSQFTPGLFAQNSPATNSGVALVIRSLSHQQNVITGDAAVGVYVDGVYVPRVQGSKFDLLDLERVEVLKGPQGTLFGRNTTGGAIQLISRAPSGNFGGNGRIALGTESFRDLSGAIEFPITDTLAGRLAASWTKRDGYGRNTLLNFDVDDKDSRSWRAYFDWNPSERVNVAFVHDGGRREESGALNQPIGVDPTGLGNFFTGGALLAAEQRAQVDPRRVRSDLDPRNLSTAFGSSVKDLSEVNDLGFALNTKISFEHFDSRTILGYRTLEVIDCEDLDGTEVEFLQGCLHLDQWNFSAEQQFLGTALDGRLDWIVGGYYFREKGKDASNFFAVIATTHQIGHV